jgi:hypothetical protein
MTANQQQTLDEVEVFADLVLGDDDWVRAEFDALIADCWDAPSEPPRRKDSPPAGGWSRQPPDRLPGCPGTPLVTAVVSQRPQSRERGPPVLGVTTATTLNKRLSRTCL